MTATSTFDLTASTPLARAAIAHGMAHMEGDATGHDPAHLTRVVTLARRIGRSEGADLEHVEIVAALHDVDDVKFTGDEHAGARAARAWLTSQGAHPDLVEAVATDVAGISFKGAGVAPKPLSLAGRCVQDADRLDALGAIGIARCFAYGGAAGRPLHDPSDAPAHHATAEQYLNNRGSSINHFYEKLLLLKDRMQTDTGRDIAEERHRFVSEFLRQFLAEWDAK